ncbi:bifunctional hydroxymethylpyrimidine kinase/phosphomethylpyrimidine kinase [Caldicellulosiruptoraceae bacterium PP1]
MKKVLVIAGFDPSCGAGGCHDIKILNMLGVYGAFIQTALTIQNTQKVEAVKSIDGDFFLRQAEFILKDIQFDAVKIGMLGNEDIAEKLIFLIKKYNLKNIVLDPVIKSTSEKDLITKEGLILMRDKLIRLCSIITPNLNEAEILTETKLMNIDDLKLAHSKLISLGVNNSVIKGGHFPSKYAIDSFCNGKEFILTLSKKHISTDKIHGTGCTYSSLLSGFLAKGLNSKDAFFKTKKVINYMLKNQLLKVGNSDLSMNIIGTTNG